MQQVLSIQSSVAYGHAGNSAAVFPLQRLGIEVWPVLTVHFSNHTGYGAWRGPTLSAADVAEVITGIEERGAFAGIDAILSGYQGDPEVAAVVVDAVRRVREANPRARYCCDPVMGDVGRGMFVRPGIPELLRDRLVPIADIVTPNHFELDFLTARETHTRAEVLEAAEVLRAKGPRTVLVTSVIVEETPADQLELIVVTDDGAWGTSTQRLPITPNGCGDVAAATFLGHLLRGDEAPEALAKLTGTMAALLEETLRAGTREIALVAAQEAIAVPPTYAVRRLD